MTGGRRSPAPRARDADALVAAVVATGAARDRPRRRAREQALDQARGAVHRVARQRDHRLQRRRGPEHPVGRPRRRRRDVVLPRFCEERRHQRHRLRAAHRIAMHHQDAPGRPDRGRPVSRRPRQLRVAREVDRHDVSGRHEARLDLAPGRVLIRSRSQIVASAAHACANSAACPSKFVSMMPNRRKTRARPGPSASGIRSSSVRNIFRAASSLPNAHVTFAIARAEAVTGSLRRVAPASRPRRCISSSAGRSQRGHLSPRQIDSAVPSRGHRPHRGLAAQRSDRRRRGCQPPARRGPYWRPHDARPASPRREHEHSDDNNQRSDEPTLTPGPVPLQDHLGLGTAPVAPRFHQCCSGSSTWPGRCSRRPGRW